MILKAIALLNIFLGGLCALLQAYRLLLPPDIGPLLSYFVITVFLIALSGLINHKQQ